MNDELAHSEIARLEERIEELHQSLARCDKIALAARIAIGGGALWLLLALVTILPFSPTALFGALASALGGVVLLGSNKTTREELDSQLQAIEDRRRALIDAMRLRLVEDPGVTLH
ncbi:MAG: hypothetical protein AB7O50_17305 [Pseudolabrys sp.]